MNILSLFFITVIPQSDLTFKDIKGCPFINPPDLQKSQANVITSLPQLLHNLIIEIEIVNPKKGKKK